MRSRLAPLDMTAAEPHLQASMRSYADRVDLRMAPDDGMATDDIHYLMAGSSALDAILSAVRLGGAADPARILDFGSGAGRVTRWLKAAFPGARIACCDLRPQDVAFCREVFQAEAWVSGTDIEQLDLRGPYDLIWIGSVLTHLDAARTRRLVDRAMQVLNPNGLLVATTSGRAIRAVQDREGAYLNGPGWPTVKRGYDEEGYGYTDYLAEEGFGEGYGLSLSSLAWVTTLATATAGRRLVMVSEAAWDGVQDVFALQAAPPFTADAGLPDARHREIDRLQGRVAELEASTSWQITAPLRRLASALKGPRRP